MEHGMEQGMHREGLSLVIRLLVRKLGEFPASALDVIHSLSLPQLEELGDALLDFTTREDLDVWFWEHGAQKG